MKPCARPSVQIRGPRHSVDYPGYGERKRVLIRGERFAKLRRWSIAKMSPEVQCPDQAAALRLGFVASSDPGLRGGPDTAGTDGPYVACETHVADDRSAMPALPLAWPTRRVTFRRMGRTSDVLGFMMGSDQF